MKTLVNVVRETVCTCGSHFAIVEEGRNVHYASGLTNDDFYAALNGKTWFLYAFGSRIIDGCACCRNMSDTSWYQGDAPLSDSAFIKINRVRAREEFVIRVNDRLSKAACADEAEVYEKLLNSAIRGIEYEKNKN